MVGKPQESPESALEIAIENQASQGTKKRRRGSGEGAIFQRGDGQWVGRMTLEGGKRKTVYAPTRKEVTAKLNEAKRKLEAGLSLDADKRTVEQFLDEWLESDAKPSVAPKTYAFYESLVRNSIKPAIGSRKLTKLTALDLQKLYTDLTTAGKSPRTAHHVHRVLHRALRKAVDWKLLAHNPCDSATAPRVPRVEMKVWTPAQTHAFLNATAEKNSLHALYVLALTTGMRQGELLGLRWSDVDLTAGTLTVQRTLQYQKGGALVFTEPKTAHSRRSINLSQKAVTALRKHQDLQVFERKAAGKEWKGQDLVFCTATGGAVNPTWITKRFQRDAAAAKLPVIRFHDVRHTAATALLTRDVPTKMVAEMLGHASIAITLDTYSHVLPTMHANAAAAMDAMFDALDGTVSA